MIAQDMQIIAEIERIGHERPPWRLF